VPMGFLQPPRTKKSAGGVIVVGKGAALSTSFDSLALGARVRIRGQGLVHFHKPGSTH